MLSSLLNLALKSTVGRVALGIGVTALLSGLAVWWYDTKHDWEEKGREECVQLVNEETHQILREQYAAALQANRLLRAQRDAAAKANTLAIERAKRAEQRLKWFQNSLEAERQNNEEYREWADTDLPDGVADRLRQLEVSGDSGPS